MHKQNTLLYSSEITQESDFSDTAYNSAHISDVQSLIAKRSCNNFRLKCYDTR